jgi:hypothetical protein
VEEGQAARATVRASSCRCAIKSAWMGLSRAVNTIALAAVHGSHTNPRRTVEVVVQPYSEAYGIGGHISRLSALISARL